jgi:hypothetical protein
MEMDLSQLALHMSAKKTPPLLDGTFLRSSLMETLMEEDLITLFQLCFIKRTLSQLAHLSIAKRIPLLIHTKSQLSLLRFSELTLLIRSLIKDNQLQPVVPPDATLNLSLIHGIFLVFILTEEETLNILMELDTRLMLLVLPKEGQYLHVTQLAARLPLLMIALMLQAFTLTSEEIQTILTELDIALMFMDSIKKDLCQPVIQLDARKALLLIAMMSLAFTLMLEETQTTPMELVTPSLTSLVFTKDNQFQPVTLLDAKKDLLLTAMMSHL